MWFWHEQNKNSGAEPADQKPTPAGADGLLTRTQLCRLRKIDRVISRTRVQDQRCTMSLEMAARQGFRPEVDRAEALRLRRLVDEYASLVARAKDEVGLDAEQYLAPEDRRLMRRVVDDHRRPVTEGPPPIEVQYFLESGVDITVKAPTRRRATRGDGLEWML